MKFKPFTRSEMKMLVYNKVNRGLKYEEACDELKGEIESMKTIYLNKNGLKENYFDDKTDIGDLK